MNLSLARRAFDRHTKIKPYRPYERLLRSVSSRGDVWIVSQGEYMAWWQRRHVASLKITVAEGACRVSSDLEDAVFERYPQDFLTSVRAGCEGSSFSGELQLVIDSTLERRDLLLEALRREGIANWTIGEGGTFFLSHELDDILERMEDHLRRFKLRAYDEDVLSIRDSVATLLSKHGLPLIRIWYHPRVEGRVIRAVISARYDVDRAITIMPKILRLEQEYGATSTMYVRVFQPFYGDKEIQKLASSLSEMDIGLHAEFDTHTPRHGSQVAAAHADTAHLAALLGRPVEGVSLHGGELLESPTESYWRAVEGCGFLWAIWSNAARYYYPLRWLMDDGQLSTTFRLNCQVKDITIPQDSFAEAFYEAATRKLQEASERGGVLVLMFHPVYFALLDYLLNPKNLARLIRFMPTYLTRLLKPQNNPAT